MSDVLDDLLAKARALVDAVSHDDNGSMVAGIWMGGNGGLLSRETIVKADALRKTIGAAERHRESVLAELEARFGEKVE